MLRLGGLLSLTSKLFKNSLSSCEIGLPVCSFYNEAFLGLDSFRIDHERTRRELGSNISQFKATLTTGCSDQNHNFYPDELKKLIYSCDGSKEDMSLVYEISSRYHAKDTKSSFNVFNFGPVIMRMYHFHKNHTEALNAFTTIENCFNQLTSYLILFDLLYEQKQYEGVVKLFLDLQKDFLANKCLPFATAALYKLNTPESFEKCRELLESTTQSFVLENRATMFAAALALNQDQPIEAQNIMDKCHKQYPEMKNIKLMALARLSKFQDCVSILRVFCDKQISSNQRRGGSGIGNTIASCALSDVEENLRREDQPDILVEFERVVKVLKEQNLVESQTLEDVLNKSLEVNPETKNERFRKNNNPIDRNQRRAMLAAAFSKGRAPHR